MNTRPVSARVLDAAIEWQLNMDGNSGSEADRAELARWLAADEEHARAWSQLGMVNQRFVLPAGPARKALQQSPVSLRRSVRKLGGGLAGVFMACGLALFVGDRYLPMDYWLADQRTATGEQREVRLADNTLVRLNTHSAIDVRFDAQQRRIILQDGEILVQTGNHDDPRPFIVETADGNMRALGTRFLVRREADGTLLSVLQSAVVAHPRNAPGEQVLHEGQQIRLTRSGFGTLLALPSGADAWTRGMLVVDNARLADMLAELGRYRAGHVGVDPKVADLRITGSFPLADTDLALKALLPTLPVQIEQHTRWWVTVLARDEQAAANPAKP
ncbi:MULTISPECIES: FecR domain-containing protein [Pseudomonas syringae group]|uniref:FecR domain-containing protein n=1 Tax=Pseudomonas syringae group TaxID=136849 RepID=UPI00020962D2|nr:MULTISPECIES: FecR family protein [Pseudomonas syringae group]EGH95045.1 regulatory protein, putative [Pseudomonas amygdali pv. lachrymans str. M302278]KPC11724.1 Regulatory protein [Pseudomonas amygdali pv. lachrymans]PYD04783.1 FecR family protein [Pseudomonas syringae pv. maculicola]RMM09205.1 Transmembrane sensor [Pseudomonas syringae]